MFLSRATILSRKSDIFKSGFEEGNLKQSSYDLRLGAEYYVVGEKAPRSLTETSPYIRLAPGSFAVLTCNEVLHVPEDLIGFITLRNRYKMQGLLNISGFHVDPTFKGKLLFAVHNIGPSDLRLKFYETTFTIFFSKVTPGIGEHRKDPELTGISLDNIQHLGGASVTLSKLKKDVDRLQTLMLIYAPFLIALFLALIMNIVRK